MKPAQRPREAPHRATMEVSAQHRGCTTPARHTARISRHATRQGAVTLIAAALAVLALLLVTAPLSHAAEKLVPARWQAKSDMHGFRYTPDMHGRVQTQYGYLYSGFTLNRAGLGVQSQLMRADGSEYVVRGRIGHLEVERRFRVDRKTSGVRVVESLRNTSSTPQQAALVIYAQLNYRYQSVVTNLGRVAGATLQKKETGVAGLMATPVRGLVVYQLCGSNSRVKPRIVANNNQTLQFHFNVQVPANGRISLMHSAVVLAQPRTPSPNSVDKFFKPFRGRRYGADLPRDIRRAMINTRRGGGGDGSSIPSVEQALAVTPGSLDQLAFSEETLLQGTASCKKLTVASAHGEVLVPFDRVAAIVGGRHATLEPHVHLRDGQKLVGPVAAKGLRFEMTSGMAIDLDVAKLDRLVLRDVAVVVPSGDSGGTGEGPGEGPGAARPSRDVAYLIETFEGNRLRTQKKTESLRVATQWGEMSIPVEELKRVYLAGDEIPGYWVELNDESRFRAFLRDDKLEMKSDLFGAITFRPHQLRRIVAVRAKRPGDEEDLGDVAFPHLTLAGGDMFVGRIDLDALHFLAPGGTLPQPPAQIRLLHNELEGSPPDPGQSLRFRAEIWGGGHITGEIRELVVPVQTARGTLRVPVRDLVDVHVPTPIVPEVLRVRLRDLITDLGHPSWEKREAASSALEDLGELAKQALQQVLRETKDPEVERRVRRLLDKI